MKKRPRRHDTDVQKEIAEALYPRVEQWLDYGESGDYNKEEVIDHLVSALDALIIWDGYSLAKTLDDLYGYSPDAQLVDILDTPIEYRIIKKKTQEWIKENNIQPEFKEGDLVLVKVKGEERQGKITKVSADVATYSVYIEELCKGSTRAYVLNFEDVKPFPS